MAEVKEVGVGAGVEWYDGNFLYGVIVIVKNDGKNYGNDGNNEEEDGDDKGVEFDSFFNEDGFDKIV